MNVFTATYIAMDEGHPCAYLLNGDEERMVTVDDFIENIEDDTAYQQALEDIKKAVVEQGLTDIIIARGW